MDALRYLRAIAIYAAAAMLGGSPVLAQTVSALPQAGQVSDTDLMLIIQGGKAYKIPANQVAGFCAARGAILEYGVNGLTCVAPGNVGLPWVSNGVGADPAYQLLTGAGGGTGVDNGSRTLTLGGSITLPAAPGSTQCLHMSSGGIVSPFGADCDSPPPLGTGGGSANAQTATFTIAPTGHSTGSAYTYLPTATNTAATTLDIGFGAVAVQSGGTPLVGGEITTGVPASVYDDGTNFQLLYAAGAGFTLTPPPGVKGIKMHAGTVFQGIHIDNGNGSNGACTIIDILNDTPLSPNPDGGAVALYNSHGITPFTATGTSHGTTVIDGIADTSSMFAGLSITSTALGVGANNYIVARGVGPNSITLQNPTSLSATGTFTVGCAQHPSIEFLAAGTSFFQDGHKLLLGDDGKVVSAQADLTLSSTAYIGWEPVGTGVNDVSIFRKNAGILAIGDGGSLNLTGMLAMGQLGVGTSFARNDITIANSTQGHGITGFDGTDEIFNLIGDEAGNESGALKLKHAGGTLLNATAASGGSLTVGGFTPRNMITITSSTANKGLIVYNGTNDVIKLNGTSGSNDAGQLSLLNAGTTKASLEANDAGINRPMLTLAGGAVAPLSIANEAGTGTLANGVVKLTAANPVTAIMSTAGDTDDAVGIVVGGAGKTGSATIATQGEVLCVFDGAATAGHYVGYSATTAGNCTDAGATRPAHGLGRVSTTFGVAGTHTIYLQLF